MHKYTCTRCKAKRLSPSLLTCDTCNPAGAIVFINPHVEMVYIDDAANASSYEFTESRDFTGNRGGDSGRGEGGDA